ncbi:MAG: ubiquinone/menaquinone biosynthesis methyltransferase [Verrucomicrobia bacterium]|nr:ubiquinone/menaquinone biosynthesis methyltransferase [Verrucomicrobiota bacterium]
MKESGYYQAGVQRAELVTQLFSSIADRYDLINDLQSFFLHRYWKHRAVWRLRPKSGESALDICCGTGDVTEILSQNGLNTVGLDFNAHMLDRARLRAGSLSQSVPQPTYLLGNALQLPFPDESFDCITMSYGLRNLADFSLGLAEMVRVARPAARMAILDFGKPRDPLLRKYYFDYLTWSVPMIGQLFAGDRDAYAYILESLQHFPDPEYFMKILKDQGLQVQQESFLGGVMSLILAQKLNS